MTDWNLGSVATSVLLLVDNVPTRLSGAPLELMADQNRKYVEKRLGVSIGSNAIVDAYQGPILHLTVADTSSQMSLEGSDKGYKLGDMTINNQGAGGSTDTVSDFWRMKAESELRACGFTARSGRTY